MAKSHSRSPESDPVLGQPGYRNRPGKTGLDPMDTYSEWGYAQGLFIRNLFTLKLRTRNPFYLGFMIVMGVLLMLPFVAVLTEPQSGNLLAGIICLGPFGIAGVFMLMNVILSLSKK